MQALHAGTGSSPFGFNWPADPGLIRSGLLRGIGMIRGRRGRPSNAHSRCLQGVETVTSTMTSTTPSTLTLGANAGCRVSTPSDEAGEWTAKTVAPGTARANTVGPTTVPGRHQGAVPSPDLLCGVWEVKTRFGLLWREITASPRSGCRHTCGDHDRPRTCRKPRCSRPESVLPCPSVAANGPTIPTTALQVRVVIQMGTWRCVGPKVMSCEPLHVNVDVLQR